MVSIEEPYIRSEVRCEPSLANDADSGYDSDGDRRGLSLVTTQFFIVMETILEKLNLFTDQLRSGTALQDFISMLGRFMQMTDSQVSYFDCLFFLDVDVLGYFFLSFCRFISLSLSVHRYLSVRGNKYGIHLFPLSPLWYVFWKGCILGRGSRPFRRW